MRSIAKLALAPWLVASLSASLSAACSPARDDEVEDEVGQSPAALVHGNGTQLNGVRINGLQVNGLQVNGVRINGLQINGLQVNGTTFSGIWPDGTSVHGADLIGATIAAALPDGGSIPLRIDAIDPTADPEINRYTVSYDSGSGWQDICGGTSPSPIQAMPLTGRWDATGTHVDDPSMFTFACRGAALAKCVEMGYKPWSTVQECKKKNECKSVSLANLHQACTRMVRADYCGDGVPHTIDGTPINVWDSFDIQTEAKVTHEWQLEAEWGVSGILCVKDLRQNVGSLTSEYIDDHCPSKWTTPDFHCFSGASTFFKSKGFSLPDASRALLRNSFDHDYIYNATNGAH
jgi:hypothetical protein